MKKTSLFLVTWIGLSLVLMVGIHWWDQRESRNRHAELTGILHRQNETNQIMLEFEKYRRENTNFRRMTPEEIASVKDHLKSAVSQKISQIQKLGAEPKEQELGAQVLEGTTELMIQGAKIEQRNPMARDLYQKEEIREIHQAILNRLDQMRDLLQTRAEKLDHDRKNQSQRNLSILLLLAIQGFVGVGLLVIRHYLDSRRPLAALKKRLHAFKRNETPPAAPFLTGDYQEIDQALSELSSLVEIQRKERHQFLVAVSQDLRGPLLSLQAGIARFMAGEHSASEILTHSAIRVSKTLDSLTDLMDMERKNLRLNEEIVELNELLERTAQSIGGSEATHPVRTHMPKTSIWVLLDAKRFENVVISLISKIIQHSPQGCWINISLRKIEEGEKRGIEVLIQQTEMSQVQNQSEETKSFSSAPKVDVLHHWISENGFGMTLAQKIMKAHGGALQVAGLSGVGIEFSLLIPQGRIASSYSTSAMGLSRSLEPQRIDSMFSEKSINLRS